MNKILKDALLNGFYDPKYPGQEMVSPRLLVNDAENKIWLVLRQELLTCRSFIWAVAFITEDMLVPFKAVMADLALTGVKGTVITGDYLGFNKPKVFRELEKIPNLKVKISRQAGFHVKGYLFNHSDFKTIIIGSANFTRSALLSNYEWSLKVSSNENATFTRQISRQLTKLEQNSTNLTETWLDRYQKKWHPTIKTVSVTNNISQEIIPNQMQKKALANLQALIDNGEHRALVVSATGTGKTYLGAFAVKAFGPKKFLYLVHRRQIAEKSLISFKRVIGGKDSDFALFTGDQKQVKAKYIFATIQTLSNPKVLQQFSPTDFDYILIDEAHRVAAPSYQTVLHYFRPRFWLGMTATPERPDKQDVYRTFDYNLAYEIRLGDALKEKMLTPFHYVGVQDYEENGQVIDETTNLRYLTAPKRVKYILGELDYYGYCGTKAKGLVFCSRQEEANKLAYSFSQLGHRAVSLTNRDSEKKRLAVVKQLEEGQLEYIITVDLFNEGIDIPALNQIVMLRNTQSSIVFIQQLGRGLRKFPGKSFVTVLDFIGNYKNNYLIPIALNGDRSCDRDQAAREAKIPNFVGLATINFSRIASKRILQSLAKTKLDSMRNLRRAYQSLKEKIGRFPLLYDFYQYGSVSPLVFTRNANFTNYASFLQRMGEDIKLSSYQSQILTFLIQELLAGKRIHELLLLKLLLEQGKVTETNFKQELKKKNAYVNQKVLASTERILSLAFYAVKTGKSSKKQQYGGSALIKKKRDCYCLAHKLVQNLQDNSFYNLFIDVIKTGLALNKNYDNERQFTLYQQYSREEVCRLLNWPLDVSAPMYGYRVGQEETPIFITYKKEAPAKRNAVYHNQLVDGRSLRWYTRTPRHLKSAEVQRLLTPQMHLYLFVKRSDASGKDFFYLGQATILKDTVKEEKIGPKKKAAVGMNLLLAKPLTASMYNLLFAD